MCLLDSKRSKIDAVCQWRNPRLQTWRILVSLYEGIPIFSSLNTLVKLCVVTTTALPNAVQKRFLFVDATLSQSFEKPLCWCVIFRIEFTPSTFYKLLWNMVRFAILISHLTKFNLFSLNPRDRECNTILCIIETTVLSYFRGSL